MRYFVVDTFTDRLFSGNPAGVCLLERELDSSLMQSIAAENNLAETAFVLPRPDGDYDLRWFTPAVEIDLCGHATLASAFVLANYTSKTSPVSRFHTKSGLLTVTRKDNLYQMDFPAREPVVCPLTPLIQAVFDVPVLEAWQSRDLLLVTQDQQAVARAVPHFDALQALPDCFGVILTAPGQDWDFVSRFFAPNAGIPEDPVTGSSHATLIPFWARRLGKEKMVAHQLSRRTGTLYVQNCGQRVLISGRATLFSSGDIRL